MPKKYFVNFRPLNTPIDEIDNNETLSKSEGIVRVYIEAPSGERFEVHISVNTKISELATDFFEVQDWPLQDSSGYSRLAVAELVNPSDPDVTSRLPGNITLGESKIKDGDTLRIFPEAVAGCFLGNTQIVLHDGNTRQIQEIQIGDIVSSALPTSGTIVASSVTKVFKRKTYTHLTLNGHLNITGSHPVFSNGKWIKAENLKVGDSLQNIAGQPVEIKSIKKRYGEFEVYNLHVESDEHTFFAENLLVHNMTAKEDSLTKTLQATDLNFYVNPTTHFMSYDVLSVGVPLASTVTLNEFFEQVTERLKAVDLVYSVFALLVSDDLETLGNFVAIVKRYEGYSITNIVLHRLLTIANIEPLRVNSLHYGSPASFDLLGIGKILEIVRDTIKDLVWKGQHDKDMAELERKSKQIEIQKSRLETENVSVSHKLETEKAALDLEAQKLANEKAFVDLLVQKVDALEKITNLHLPDDEKRIIVSALLPSAQVLVEKPVTPILKGRASDKLLPRR